MTKLNSKSTKRSKKNAVQQPNTRIIHDFGRDYIFDDMNHTITAVDDPNLKYDFAEASRLKDALNCGEVDTLEHLWKDKRIGFRSLLSDDPSRNTHNDEFNFRRYGCTNCRSCGSALFRSDTSCDTCDTRSHRFPLQQHGEPLFP
jgi:hypothetical protein